MIFVSLKLAKLTIKESIDVWNKQRNKQEPGLEQVE